MPKTYTATEVKEIVRECLGEEEIYTGTGEYDRGIRNSLRSLALEKLEKRLLANKK